MGVIPMAHLDDGVYADPNRFDPARYFDPKTSEKLIWPHGSYTDSVSKDGHDCPGKHVGVLYAKLLCTRLIVRFDWSLKEPAAWSDTRYGLNVAAPIGPMETKSFNQI